jgi:hypothetical protein
MAETKGEKFYNILKALGCSETERSTPHNFQYLFDLKETKDFFEWFINNVDESCTLTQDELHRFNEKLAKGQVVFDTEKLEKLNGLINSNQSGTDPKALVNKLCVENLEEDEDLIQDFDDVDYNDAESLRRSNERMEKELEMLNKQIEMKKFCRNSSNQNLLSQNERKVSDDALKIELDEQIEAKKKNSKILNQELNKTLIEFQSKLSDEEKLIKHNKFFSLQDPDVQSSVDNYIANEQQLLNEINELMSLEIDLNAIKNLDCASTSINQLENREDTAQKEIQIMLNTYPKLLEVLFDAKIKTEYDISYINELVKIIENKSDFFQAQFVPGQRMPALSEKERQNWEAKIRKLELLTGSLSAKCQELTKPAYEKMNKYAKLKIANLLQFDVLKKECETSLMLNTQAKLGRALTEQKIRVEFVKHLKNLQMNEMDDLRQVLENVIAETSSFSQLIPNMSLFNTTAAQNTNKTMLNPFTTSTANLFSSTMISQPGYYGANSFSSSPSRLNNKGKLAYKLNGGPFFGDAQFLDGAQNIEIINQFLIAVLAKLQQDQLNTELTKAKNPISTNFNDNLESFMGIVNTIDSAYKKCSQNEWRKKVLYTNKLINYGIEYLYDKESSSNQSSAALKQQSMSNSTLKYNFNRTNIRLVKGLEEPLRNLNEKKNQLQNQFVGNIHQHYDAYKRQLASNKLIELKKNFFIHFYTNPQVVNMIIEQINAMNF